MVKGKARVVALPEPQASLSDLAILPRWVAWEERERNGKQLKFPSTRIRVIWRERTTPRTFGTREQAERRWSNIKKNDSHKGGRRHCPWRPRKRQDPVGN